MTKPIDEVLACLENVKTTKGGWTARCPAHDDKKNSLSLKVGDDQRVLAKCHAGCQFQAIVDATPLTVDQFFPPKPFKKKNSEIIATYDYTDEKGNLLYQVCRTKDKQFPQRRPDRKDGWLWGLGDVEPVLYRLPQVLFAIQDRQTLFIVEGEKDADRLLALGASATTSPMGAGKWRESYTKTLQGCKEAVLLPDNDPPGQAHTERIAAELHNIGVKVKILQLPDLPPGGDVSDWLDADGTLNKLLALIEQTKPFNTNANITATASLEEESFPLTSCLPPFPISVLPQSVQEIVTAYADSVCAAIDIAAVQALSITSLALGPNWEIEAKGFRRPSRLWTAIVAPPGSAKTPVMLDMMVPIEQREELFRMQWEQQLKEWKSHKGGEQYEAADSKEERPTQSHAKTDDFNIDSLISALSFSPQGIILDIDELTQLFGLIEQTHTGGKGRSRGAFLSMWSGKPVSVLRKRADDLYVKNPYVIVCGGTQPDTLRSLGLTQGDGMIQRFLWSHPNQPKEVMGYGEELPSCIKKVWEDTIFNAFETFQGTAPVTSDAIAFGNEAIKHFNQQKNEMNEASLSAFGAMYAKAPDHLHRLVACLHGMNCLFENKIPQPVELGVFERANTLLEYFLAHSKHCISLAMSGKSEETTFQELREKDKELFKALKRLIEIQGQQTCSTSEWNDRLKKYADINISTVRLGKALKRLSEFPFFGLIIERPETKNEKARLWNITLDDQ